MALQASNSSMATQRMFYLMARYKLPMSVCVCVCVCVCVNRPLSRPLPSSLPPCPVASCDLGLALLLCRWCTFTARWRQRTRRNPMAQRSLSLQTGRLKSTTPTASRSAIADLASETQLLGRWTERDLEDKLGCGKQTKPSFIFNHSQPQSLASFSLTH